MPNVPFIVKSKGWCEIEVPKTNPPHDGDGDGDDMIVLVMPAVMASDDG